jgi:hypothetical protein
METLRARWVFYVLARPFHLQSIGKFMNFLKDIIINEFFIRLGHVIWLRWAIFCCSWHSSWNSSLISLWSEFTFRSLIPPLKSCNFSSNPCLNPPQNQCQRLHQSYQQWIFDHWSFPSDIHTPCCALSKAGRVSVRGRADNWLNFVVLMSSSLNFVVRFDKFLHGIVLDLHSRHFSWISLDIFKFHHIPFNKLFQFFPNFP